MIAYSLLRTYDPMPKYIPFRENIYIYIGHINHKLGNSFYASVNVTFRFSAWRVPLTLISDQTKRAHNMQLTQSIFSYPDLNTIHTTLDTINYTRGMPRKSL